MAAGLLVYVSLFPSKDKIHSPNHFFVKSLEMKSVERTFCKRGSYDWCYHRISLTDIKLQTK